MMKLDIQLFAVPFRKTSKTRKRMRRTHYKISENGTTKCPKCGADVRPHRVCAACGTYKGKNVITGRTRNNKIVHIPYDEDLTGEFVNVKITGVKTWYLNGEMIK